MPFDFAGVTRRISEILSGILSMDVKVPGNVGVDIPLWLLIAIGILIVVLVWNPYKKER